LGGGPRRVALDSFPRGYYWKLSKGHRKEKDNIFTFTIEYDAILATTSSLALAVIDVFI
jgi:hypothetical protein